MDVILANGTIYTTTPEKNAHLWQAFQVSKCAACIYFPVSVLGMPADTKASAYEPIQEYPRYTLCIDNLNLVNILMITRWHVTGLIGPLRHHRQFDVHSRAAEACAA